MNNRQLAAIRKVEEAMVELEASGLILAGIDTDLLVFSKRQYYSIAEGRFGHSPAEVINELDYQVIECPYLDSGGT